MLRRIVALATLVASVLVHAQPQPTPSTGPQSQADKPKLVKTILADELAQREWTIGHTKRIALLHIPEQAKKSQPGGAKPSPVPVVFAFHGHGGTARSAATSFHIQKVWPEALVVYMQGLPTPSVLVDPEGKKNGWQNMEGQQGDRDLAFFDAVFASLKSEYNVDVDRIYATGHSNGGGFTYLLWRARADAFAAFAPSAAGGARLGKLTPKPAMHIAGRNDELVKFEMQEKNIEAVKKTNACEDKGQPWADHCTLYPSKTGTPFVAYIHDGTHKYPSEAPALIVKFFKEHAKPQAVPAPKPGDPPAPAKATPR